MSHGARRRSMQWERRSSDEQTMPNKRICFWLCSPFFLSSILLFCSCRISGVWDTQLQNTIELTIQQRWWFDRLYIAASGLYSDKTRRRNNFKMTSVKRHMRRCISSITDGCVGKNNWRRCSLNCSMVDGTKECLMIWTPISFSISIHCYFGISLNNWDRSEDIHRFSSFLLDLRRHWLCDRSTFYWLQWVSMEVHRQPTK